MSSVPTRWLLAAGFVISVALVAGDLGLASYGTPSDELFYHEATRRHVAWFANWSEPAALSERTLAEQFRWRPDSVIHPTFARLLSGGTWALFHRGLGVDEIVALRLHNALVYALVAVAIAGFAARRFGLPAAGAAFLLSWGHVRYFGHAHAALPGFVLSGLWLFGTLCLARGVIEERPRWVAAAALISGLALATKLTGLQLVLLLAAWPIFARGPAAWRATLVLLVVPPVVFTLLNPASWHGPIGYWSSVFGDFFAREDSVFVPTWFLGVRYFHRVPWYAPGLHALLTTPPILLVLAGLAALRGLGDLWRSGAAERRAWLAGPWPLLLAAGLSPIAVTSLPALPSHDVDRQFVHAQPFLILFAVVGFDALLRSGPVVAGIRRLPAAAAAWAPAALAVVLCAPPLVQAAREHPYELTYWNALIGGAAAAETAGFDVAYLKIEANASVLRELEARVPANASVYANFLNWDLTMHQNAGRLRRDIRVVREPDADFVIVHNRRSWMTLFEARLWNSGLPPDWALRHRGVDLVRLYRGPVPIRP